MAEFLIKAISATHTDPSKDTRGAYKRGDVVVVMPDRHEWGAAEGLPTFVVVKIPGLDVEKAKAFLEPETEIDQETGERVTTRRRRWGVKWNDLPLGVRNALRDNGEVTVTWAQVRNFVENKTTLAVAPESL